MTEVTREIADSPWYKLREENQCLRNELEASMAREKEMCREIEDLLDIMRKRRVELQALIEKASQDLLTELQSKQDIIDELLARESSAPKSIAFPLQRQIADSLATEVVETYCSQPAVTLRGAISDLLMVVVSRTVAVDRASS